MEDCDRFTLLQPFLVGFELLFQRFDQGFDGFLPLGQVALGGFLEFSEGLFRQPQKFRRALFQCLRAQCLERLAQIHQRLVLQRALLHQHFFRCCMAGFRRGAGIAGFGQFRAQPGEFGLALADLLPQFVFQP